MALAHQYYDNHTADFLVLDISSDDTALSVLATVGDPFRYLAVRDIDIVGLIEFALTVAPNRQFIIIDDLAQNIPASVYHGRGVQFEPKSFHPLALSGC